MSAHRMPRLTPQFSAGPLTRPAWPARLARALTRGAASLAVVGACLLEPAPVVGQTGQPPTKPAPGKTAPGKTAPGKTAPGKPAPAQKKYTVADWPQLVARKREFLERTDKLKAEFEAADKANDNAARQRLITQFRGIQQEFGAEVQAPLLELAPRVYAADPTDVDAAEIVITVAFQDNKYTQVIDMVNKVLAAGHKSAPLLTFLGASQFATHDFVNAQKTLTAAKAVDQNVFPVIGEPFLKACNDYQEFWAAEQEIRAAEQQADDLPRVLLKTTQGDIVIELFENEAPNTVANFISLVEQKQYDGLLFHRVIPNFMAQGGDPNTLDADPQNDGQGGPGYVIPCECYAPQARRHFQGSLSMAHAGKDTGGSQFFLTHLPTPHLNPNADEKRGHTVFGRVIKGLDNALALRKEDRIESAKVLRKRDHAYEPKTLPDPRARKPAPKKPAPPADK